MKNCFLILCLLSSWGAAAQSLPATPQRPVTDTYFGRAVVDNYRWLEDTKSPEVLAWFKAQGDYTKQTLDRLPGRDSLLSAFVRYDRLRPARYSEIRKRGNRYFYRKTLPAEKVGKLYLREGATGAETLLFDPVAYNPAKTYSVTAFTPSNSGQQLVVGLQEGGAELSTLRIMTVATKALLPESIVAVSGGGVDWLPTDTGFLYTPNNSTDPKDPLGNLNTKARLHRLGTPASADPELFSRAKNPAFPIRPDEYPFIYFSDDHTQVYAGLGSVDNRQYVWVATPADLGKPTIPWQPLAVPTDSVYSYLKLGAQLYLYSVKGAPKGRILVTDAAHPKVATATVLLPEGSRNITGIVSSKDYLFVTLNDGINDHIRQYDPRSRQWADVPLPFSGTAYVQPLDAPRSNAVLLGITSWKQPATLYDYNPDSKKLAVSNFEVKAEYPGVADLVVEEVEVPSHDGAMVPLSLIYRKGLQKNGQAICFMDGYGAYGISAVPAFSTRYLAMLNQGVVIAETHPRGGSEKGQKWYRAGYQTTKPNTWKDFIACGDYLVKNGYTSPSHLIGMGTSAGGILIGRAITERPDLFAAAISNVSCSNMLRQENTPNGPVNVPEFGSVKDPVQCQALYEMDAFQHVKPGTKYPAVMCVGGMNDPRVIVWQPGKLAAALQAATTSGKPVLMQVNYDNGHFTEDKAVTFRNFANMYAFALWQAGHPNFQPATVAVK
ncbi:S9 family peptidase [Hymenobacter sp. UV11]|uniref:prolyl oligopeptidase family serine peptidase n=1 Tax=Hymenobacter sp. UV11 TaxID=1849735 RepID=UPI001061C3D2|nr:prolyl oligopeptidase family serine peptidase [Hymenobacter sp. UV11]TDN37763.1 prolyl oligopeptidase [Hymenobacter sp. UV11]TFZ68964.1 S9 family peptidase [Hymenobacter sp. UV11]